MPDVDDPRLLRIDVHAQLLQDSARHLQRDTRLRRGRAGDDPVSRAAEFHHRALAEPDVRLAPHPAPIVRPRPYRSLQ